MLYDDFINNYILVGAVNMVVSPRHSASEGNCALNSVHISASAYGKAFSFTVSMLLKGRKQGLYKG